MTPPSVATRLREGQLKRSPIREIMKLAERKNILELGLDPDEVISFAGGWVDHEAPAALRDQYRKIAGDPELFHQLGAYSPTRGLPQLRKALVEADRAFFGTQGLTDEHIMVGQSSTQLTYTLFLALLNPGDRVLIFDPSYANYGPQLELGPEGLEVLRLPVFDQESWQFMPDPDDLLGRLEETLARHAPRLIIFSTPDNPTSQLVPDQVFNQILEAAAQADCFVAVDYAYRGQCFEDPEPESFAASPAEHENLIRVHSNSKWCRGLGRRLGWIEAAPHVVQAVEVVQQSTALCGDTVHQFALANYLEQAVPDGSLRAYLQAARDAYRTAGELTTRCIEEYLGMPHSKPQGGLYSVVDVGRDGDEFVREVLANTGVIFVPGSGFGPSLARGIRVSFGPMVRDLSRLEEGFKRVGQYLQQ